MTRAACESCFRSKKKCDKNLPCSRCLLSGRDCIEREQSGVARPKGIRYTTHACVACNQSKVRCSAIRPCKRCIRLGYDCTDFRYKKNSYHISHTVSIAPSNAVSPYSKGSRIPIPDLESIFQNFSEFLGTMSPFLLSELLTGSEMYFISCVACETSVLPVRRRREFLLRMLKLAAFDDPQIARLASNRVESYLDSGQLTIPCLNGMEMSPNYREYVFDHVIDSSLSDQQIIDYYLYHHQFTSFPECIDGTRPGVLVNLFLDPDHVDGSNILLFGAVNSEAENYTGYTSEEYNSFQNVISSGFTNFDGFPETLRIYHRDDIHRVMTKGMLSSLTPGVEIPFEARLIHKNGRFVYVRCAHLTFVKPNGQIKAVVTALLPFASI